MVDFLLQICGSPTHVATLSDDLRETKLTIHGAQLELEDELLTKWTREKAQGKIPVDQVEELLKGI